MRISCLFRIVFVERIEMLVGIKKALPDERFKCSNVRYIGLLREWRKWSEVFIKIQRGLLKPVLYIYRHIYIDIYIDRYILLRKGSELTIKWIIRLFQEQDTFCSDVNISARFSKSFDTQKLSSRNRYYYYKLGIKKVPLFKSKEKSRG